MSAWTERIRQECADVQLLSIEQLRALPECSELDAGVYFLWLRGELRYIGKSRRIWNRLIQHEAQPRRACGTLRFDRHTVLVVDNVPVVADLEALDAKLRWLERAYIAHYEPPLNCLEENPGT